MNMLDLGLNKLEISEEIIVFNVRLALGNNSGAVLGLSHKSIDDISNMLNIEQINDLPYKAAESCSICGHMLTRTSPTLHNQIIVKRFCAIKSSSGVSVYLV